MQIEFSALNAINALHEICASCHNICNTWEDYNYYLLLHILGWPESSCRFLVSGVRTGLNISERLKTNDMRTYRKRYGTSGILEKKFGCETLIFVSFIRL